MTIKELRNAYKRNVEFSKMAGTGLESYIESEWRAFEDLYKEGTITNFSSDFLARANGFQTTTGEYENLHILQTLDLHRISASKAVTRAMMQRFLNVT